MLLGSCILVDTNGLAYPIEGPAEMLSQELAIAPVDKSSLRQQWRDLIGKSFTLYTPGGKNRQVVIKSFQVVSLVNDGADEFRTIWEEHQEHGLSESEFKNLSTAHLLVAVFDEINLTGTSISSLSDGTNLQWARLSSLGEPKLGKAVGNDESLNSRMDKFIKGSSECKSTQDRYHSYVQDQKSQEEGRKNLPATWFEHATIERANFKLSGRDISFVSMKSRANCGEDGFDAELNALSWTTEIQFPDFFSFPYSATDRQSLIFAWDNEAKENLDLLFTDGLEWITFVRILPDGTTRSFVLHVPYTTQGC